MTEPTNEARELLAAEYEAAGRPLVAIDLRTGNVGRMGVNFVDREIAERAIEKALSRPAPDGDEVEVVARAIHDEQQAAMEEANRTGFLSQSQLDEVAARAALSALPSRATILEEAAAYIEAQAKAAYDTYELIAVQSDLPISEPTFSCEGLRQIAAAIRALGEKGGG